jgi:phospholipase C
MASLTRRQFLVRSSASLAALSAPGSLLRAASGKKLLPKPEHSGIEHIVVCMMENRSFDHFVGWLPGADGMQAGLSYPDTNRVYHPTYHLTVFQGCGHVDPDHSYDGGRIEYDGGLCDGWLVANQNDLYPIGYYLPDDLPFLGNAATDWTAFDRYFAPIMAPTYPNRMYQHAGVTDRLDSETTISTLPTIWDRLAQAGVTGRYYFNDLPFLALWGTKYTSIFRTFDQFIADCAAGTLPGVAFVDPPFAGETEGTSSDDHPFGDIRAGEYFLSRVYDAVTSGPRWKQTVLVINFDEWGGFFDHVAPGQAPDVDPAFQLRGFRVPALLISPYARRGFVSSGVYDHTSVLKMIEWRWALAPLSVRDANANNLAEALDFSTRNLAAPSYAVAPFVSSPCLV